MTIKKTGINALEIPSALFDTKSPPQASTRFGLTPSLEHDAVRASVHQLRQLTQELSTARSRGEWMKVERLDEHAQPLIADLYGLDAAAFTLISHWYKQRAKRSRYRNLPGLKRVQQKTNPLAPPSNDLAESPESAHKH